MNFDEPITNSDATSMTNRRLKALAIMDSENDVALDRATEQLDQARFAKVMRMTAQQFGRLEPAEKRNYTRWANGFAKAFAEKAALFERNSTREPELPDALRG